MAGGSPDSTRIFPYFVIDVTPGGLRSLVIAGVLATTMGSLATAMNSLATSDCQDFHFHRFGTPNEDAARVRIVKLATVGFMLVLIAVGLATAFVKTHNPGLNIIGYTYGSLLGVFIVALFTKKRGSKTGNMIAMASGIIAVVLLSNLPNDVSEMILGRDLYENPTWMPVIEFQWRILAGTIVTVAVALCFKS